MTISWTRGRRAAVALAALLTIAAAPVPATAALPLVSATPESTVGFDGLVYASAYVGSTVYVGGSFGNAMVDGKKVPRKRLAALDARTGKLLPWAPQANGTIWAMVAAGSSVYVSGKFTTVGGQSRAGLAGLDLSTGAVGKLRATVKGSGLALTAGSGRLYLGGSISSVDGRAVGNLAAFKLADETVDTGFRGSTDGEVRALSVGGSRLYVGGSFKRAGNSDNTARLAALGLDDGQVDTTFRPATPYGVMALTHDSTRIYAGLSGPGGRVATYRVDGSLVWSTVTDGDIQALVQLRGVVYAGGHFVVSCTRPSRNATAWCPTTMPAQPKLVAFDATTGWLLDWNPRSNGKWGVLTMSAGAAQRTFAVGGEMTAFGGASRPHFALFSGIGYGTGGGRR
ncbi:hypothetical protein [Actinoplanes sp. NPDC049265]|uniref:hypothetical protein n=1 Tax=Actinoplanes sp. NPDC049265 TaxID=3363902 RepID=UPI00371DC0E7